jgi:hypothetical protein
MLDIKKRIKSQYLFRYMFLGSTKNIVGGSLYLSYLERGRLNNYWFAGTKSTNCCRYGSYKNVYSFWNGSLVWVKRIRDNMNELF